MAELITHVLNGVVLGLLYAVIALGFMLILGMMEVINFSHGVLFALGGYLALTLQPHVGWGAALVLAPLAVGVLGLVLEVGLRRTYGRDPLFGLLFTFGGALALEELIRMVWGPQGQTVPAPAFLAGPFHVGFLFYSKYRLLVGGLAIVLLAGVWAFLERTPYGAIIKAGAYDSEMVHALGINLGRARMAVFGLGAALAGMAGVVAAPMWGLKPTVGTEAVMPALIVVVIGGIGSFWGSVIGGLMLGIASALANLVVPRGSILAMYVLMTIVLLWRPRGLLGQKSVLEL
ncbi:MAG: branched-chain amino acid ABC transporter permease [Chloroflexi bacterium 13_1_40CM_68_21]|nr:MAG: branched-chain amino acid ABC transporter permease [Chloroflexi bacterium 13_1_40CM_68_21]